MFKGSKKVIGQDIVERRLDETTKGKFGSLYIKKSEEGKVDMYEKMNAAYILSYPESIKVSGCTISDINLYYTDKKKFVVDYSISFDEIPQKAFATFETFDNFAELSDYFPELAKAIRLKLLKEE